MKIFKSLRTNLSFIKKIWKKNKLYVFLMAVTNLINSVFPIINIIIPKLVIDTIMHGNSVKYVVFYILILIVANVAWGAINGFLNDNYLSVQGSMCSMQLLVGISAKAAELDMKQIENHNTLVKLNMAKNVIYKGIDYNLISGFFSFIGSLILLITLSSLLFSVSFWFVPIIIIISILNVFISYRIELNNAKFQETYQDSMTKMNYFSDILEGKGFIKEIRLYNLASWIKRKCNNTINELNKSIKKKNLRWYPFRLLQVVLTNFLNYGLYLWLAIMAFLKTITIGTFTMLFSSVSSFSNNFGTCIKFISSLSINSEYISSYDEFMSIESELSKLPLAKTDDFLTDEFSIKFDNVSFKYNDSQNYILSNLNFEFYKGQTYAIVGKNGAGKTTLINLLCRLYDPTIGSITCCGNDIRNYDLDIYRDKFSAIFQNFANLSFSIRDNICLDKDFKENFANNLIDDLKLSELINSLPNKYNTYLNKRIDSEGIILSGGQEQRLAIIRALYRNPEILILDEPTSALDPISEDALIKLIHRQIKNKMIIYVSHRLSSVSMADCVIFIDNNTIEDYGPHKKLYEKNLKYREFYDAQAKYYK